MIDAHGRRRAALVVQRLVRRGLHRRWARSDEDLRALVLECLPPLVTLEAVTAILMVDKLERDTFGGLYQPFSTVITLEVESRRALAV